MKTAYLRYFASLLSGIVLFGYLMPLFNSRKQTLHDWIVETVVTDAEIPDVNFFKVWLEQMKSLLGILDTNLDTASAPLSANSADHFKNGSSNQEGDHAIMTLEQLHKLLQNGAITEEEFSQKKAELLKKI